MSDEPAYAVVKATLLEVLELDAGRRDGFLDALAQRDRPLHEAVVALLAHEAAPDPAEAIAALAGDVVHAETGTPQQIGPYRVLGVLGEGGMGIVYRAEQAQPRREVALKCLRSGFISSEQRARFSVEAQALARMDHPHIAAVYDASGDAGQPYLAMQLVDGVPLTTWCVARASNLAQRLDLFLAICQAVRHAHQRGVIHRDLKPSNLLVAERDGVGWPMVIDFGIAKPSSSGDNPELTVADQIIGTPAYMSPEQAGAFGGVVDTRTDVYALGIVLYELLTATRPHTFESTLPEHLREVLTDTVPGPASQVPDPPVPSRSLRGDLDNIVGKAIRADPDRRYPSVEALIDDLERYRAGLPVLARGDGFTYRASRFLRRHWRAVGVGVGAALSLAVFSWSTYLQSERLALERDRALAAELSAKEEADAAAQVTEFLTELFRSADPANVQGREPRVRDLLELGQERVATELQDQPLTRARLLATFAGVHQSLGDAAKAEALLREALSLQIDAAGPGSAEVADTRWSLGGVLHDQGHYERAIRQIRASLQLLKSAHGERSEEVAGAMNSLAVSLDATGNYAEAEPLYEQSLAIYKSLFGTEHVDVVWGITTLGQVRYRRGDVLGSAKLFQEAVDIGSKLFDGPAVELALAWNNLGGAQHALDQLEDAEASWRAALAQFRALYGEEHATVGRGLANLARALTDLGLTEEALVVAQEGVDVLASTVGADSRYGAAARRRVAEVLAERGDLDTSRREFRSALEAEEAIQGPEHPTNLLSRSTLASLDWRAGDLDAAEEGLARAATGLASALSDTNRSASHARTQLTLLRLARGVAVPCEPVKDAGGPYALPNDHWQRTLSRATYAICSASKPGPASMSLGQDYRRLVDRFGAQGIWPTRVREAAATRGVRLP